MKKAYFILVWLLAATAVLLECLCVKAEESGSVQAKLPVSCTEKAYVHIEPLGKNNLMPDHEYIFITEEESGAFVFTYTEPGVYKYKVTQAMTDPGIEYDTREYEAWIYVLYQDDGQLSTTVVVSNNLDEDKSDSVSFGNSANPNATQEPGDEPGPTSTPEEGKTATDTSDRNGQAQYAAMLACSSTLLLLAFIRLRKQEATECD